MKLGYKILITTLVVAGVTYGVITFQKQAALIKALQYNVSNKKFHITSPSQVEVSFDINFNNQSDLAFTIITYSFDIFLDNSKIGNSISYQSIHVDRLTTNTVPIKVAFNPIDVLGIALAGSPVALLGSTIYVKGSVLVNNKIFFARIPIDFNYKLADAIGI